VERLLSCFSTTVTYKFTVTAGSVEEARQALIKAARAPHPELDCPAQKVKWLGYVNLPKEKGFPSSMPPKGYYITITSSRNHDRGNLGGDMRRVYLACKQTILMQMEGFTLAHDESTSWEQDLVESLQERYSALGKYRPLLRNVLVWNGEEWKLLLDHIGWSGRTSNGRKGAGKATRKKKQR